MSIMNINIGRIDLICGPRYAGKTTELLRLCNQYKFMNFRIVVIKNDKLQNFNTIPLLYCKEIIEMDDFLSYDVIAIDDAHLIDDLHIVVPLLADKFHKKIIVAGLDQDENQNFYTNVIHLIPHCEKLNKLHSFCETKKDGSNATFTKNGKPICRSELLQKEVGHLTVITGPMFSGKSTEIIRLGKKYLSIGKKIIAVNFSKDKRYDNEAKICSHNNEKFEKTISLDDLKDIYFIDEFQTAQIILIDEIQFFKNAFYHIKKIIEDYQKICIVSGLDGDFKREPFGDVCKLVSYADDAKKLNAICCVGKKIQEAPFSRRIINNDQIQLIGSNDMYCATSREIYNLNNEEFLQLFQNKEKNYSSSFISQ